MSTPVEIAVAVVERDEMFLIGLRPADGPLAGYWEFPGGKIQPGEAAADAAVRECLEETGLRVSVQREYPAVEHSYSHARLRLRFFACEPACEDTLTANSRFRWVARKALANYAFPPANRELLATLQSRGC